jgi:hypothetical protein
MENSDKNHSPIQTKLIHDDYYRIKVNAVTWAFFSIIITFTVGNLVSDSVSAEFKEMVANITVISAVIIPFFVIIIYLMFFATDTSRGE